MNKYIVLDSYDSNYIEVEKISSDLSQKKFGGIQLIISVRKSVIDELGISFKELNDMFCSNTKISYYESEDDGATKTIINSFDNFCLNYKCSYSEVDDTFVISLRKRFDVDILTETNQNDTIEAYAAIAELYEAKLAAVSE